MVECKQCGQCCRHIWLPLPPAELQKRYAVWLTGKGDRNAGIHLIYPMLKWTGEESEVAVNLGKPIKKWMYKCAHLLELDNTTACVDESIMAEYKTICTIHAHRPDMCRDYPFYGNKIIPETITIYDGCVFKKEFNRRRKKK